MTDYLLDYIRRLHEALMDPFSDEKTLQAYQEALRKAEDELDVMRTLETQPETRPEPSTVRGRDFLAQYPAEIREAALDILRERDPEAYARAASRWRAVALP